VRILLDTHVWLWTLVSPERIPQESLDLLSNPDNELYLSAASTWEIAIKYCLGKLPLPEPPALFVPSRLSRDGVISLPVEHAHTLAVAELPPHHNDPFDRLLVAQARIERMSLASVDAVLKKYEVELLPM
jgi:PIN domain nuclease of toxin-antitoxin system